MNYVIKKKVKLEKAEKVRRVSFDKLLATPGQPNGLVFFFWISLQTLY